jgi:DNA repair protein RecO
VHLKHDLAIILKSVFYEERHRIVTALTKQHGLISAIAKNSIQSRRFGGTLEIFAASEWTFTQKPGAELCHLSEANIRNDFRGLRKDFQRLSLASALNELILKLAPQNHVCEELFKLHSNALFILSEASSLGLDSSGVSFLNAYLAKLLQWSGSQPRLNDCLQCQASLDIMEAQTELSCIISDAGWICTRCRSLETRHIQGREGNAFQHSMLRLTAATLRDFQMSLKTPIRQIPTQLRASPQEHRKLFKFLEALYVFHIPGFDRKSLKSLRFLGLESSVQPEVVIQQ